MADGDHPNLSELVGPYLESAGAGRGDRPAPAGAENLAALVLEGLWKRCSPRLEGEQAWARAQHDLQGLTDFALWQEAERARSLLAWLQDPPAWIAEHYRAAQAEQARRRKGAR